MNEERNEGMNVTDDTVYGGNEWKPYDELKMRIDIFIEQLHILTHSLIHHFETAPNAKQAADDNSNVAKCGYQRTLRHRLQRKHCGKR